jgi:hypothetical protein
MRHLHKRHWLIAARQQRHRIAPCQRRLAAGLEPQLQWHQQFLLVRNRVELLKLLEHQRTTRRNHRHGAKAAQHQVRHARLPRRHLP